MPPAPPSAAALGGAAPTTGRLPQVDVVRLLTFLAVIAVHSLAFTESPSDGGAAGAMMLLQFGREVFFAITAFVLVHSWTGRRMSVGAFWPRRLAYVAVPYVTWSAIYVAYGVVGPAHLSISPAGFGLDLLDGGAMYHLYFLLVTLQLYLAFPVLNWFVRRTARRAGWVLGVATAANLGWLAALQYGTAPHGGAAGWVWGHAYLFLPSYTMYVLAGAYGAVHLPRLQQVVTRRPGRLVAVAGACAAGAVVLYALQLRWMAPRTADAVLQPAMLLSCVAAGTLLYVLGSRWAAGRQRGRSAIDLLSDASFGVYLAHPLILQLLLDHGFGNGHQVLPAPVCTVVGIVAAAAGGVALSLLARRTPLSLALTGRPRRRPRPARHNVTAAVSSGPRFGGLLTAPSPAMTFEGKG